MLRLVLLLELLALPAVCQMIYSISVYNDASTDGNTLYAVSTSVDTSTGCSAHGSYSTTARLIAPDGAQSANTSGGMVANTSMAINAQVGTFTGLGTVQLYCGCFAHWVGGGGTSLQITVANARTGFKWPLLLQDADGWYCRYTATSCATGTPTCTSGSWTSIARVVPPCPNQILVDWIRVKILGVQMCFVTEWDDVSSGIDCQ